MTTGWGPRLAGGVAVALAIAIMTIFPTACAPAQVSFLPQDWRLWKVTTGLRLDYPIPGHEDRLRVPRMNGLGFSTVQGLDVPLDFPEGTIIAKEVYARRNPLPGEVPVQVTIMVKSPKDPLAKGGWIWISKDLASGKETVFATKFCVGCHANANEAHPYADKNPKGLFRDYVFIVPAIGPVSPPAIQPNSPTAAEEESGEGYGYRP